MKTRPGSPDPLGATWDGSGVNFVLFPEHATGVELCLFDGPDGNEEAARIPLAEQTHQVWHIYLPEVRPGQRYGYNNAYCQDSEISWFGWRLDKSRRDLLALTRHLIRLRRGHPVLRHRQFFYGRRVRGSEVKDLAWFRPDGKEMTDENWRDPLARCIGLRLFGDAIEEVDARGERITDDTLLVLLNAHHEPVPFVLPAHRPGVRWEVILDTRTADGHWRHRATKGGEAYDLEGRCLALLRLQAKP